MSATYIVLVVSDIISHAAPTLCINVPMSETKSAIRRLRNIGMRSGRQGLDDVEESVFSEERISDRCHSRMPLSPTESESACPLLHSLKFLIL